MACSNFQKQSSGVIRSEFGVMQSKFGVQLDTSEQNTNPNLVISVLESVILVFESVFCYSTSVFESVFLVFERTNALLIRIEFSIQHDTSIRTRLFRCSIGIFWYSNRIR